MPITRMNHFTVLCDDLALTVKFYTELLGLREGPRPPIGVPGRAPTRGTVLFKAGIQIARFLNPDP